MAPILNCCNYTEKLVYMPNTNLGLFDVKSDELEMKVWDRTDDANDTEHCEQASAFDCSLCSKKLHEIFIMSLVKEFFCDIRSLLWKTNNESTAMSDFVPSCNRAAKRFMKSKETDGIAIYTAWINK